LYRNNKEKAKQVIAHDATINIKMYEHVKAQYAQYRKENKVYDYTDLLEVYLKRGHALPIKVAFIDEAQDLTTLQWEVVDKLFACAERIYIAGDDDQAIYQWSGADVDRFLRIKGEELVLNKSHRLPQSVLDLAQGISKRIKNRKEKQFEGTREQGEISYIGSCESIPKLLDEDTLILCRNNKYLRRVEEVFQQQGIRYTLGGEDPIPALVLNGIRKYEMYRKNLIPREQLAAYSQYFITLNRTELPWYEVLNKPLAYKNYLRAIFRYKTTETKPTTRLSTIHSIKGAEAKTVILLLDVSPSVQRNMLLDPDSELRVLYVGVTRAKQRLIVSLSQSQHSFTI
jgi:superfamily I DNA/RNA helicase